MNAVLLMSFCLGNILGPLTFRDEDAPQYVPAKITIVAVDSVTIVLTVVLLGYYVWQNRKKEKLTAGMVQERDVEFKDLTDKENLWFRYRY